MAVLLFLATLLPNFLLCLYFQSTGPLAFMIIGGRACNQGSQARDQECVIPLGSRKTSPGVIPGLWESHGGSHVKCGRVGERRSPVGMRCTAQNQSKPPFLFVSGSFTTVAQPIMSPTPLAFPRADARAHLGAATCLRPADTSPPWGRLYKSRSLGSGSPGYRASFVLSTPSGLRLRRGYRLDERQKHNNNRGKRTAK